MGCGVRTAHHPGKQTESSSPHCVGSHLLNAGIALWTSILKYTQGVLSAVNDYFLYRLARAYFDRRSAKWALFCQLFSWFLFFVMVRPYSNSIETVCTTGALAYWPWKFLNVDTTAKKKDDASLVNPMKKSNRALALSLAALGVLFRPTNVVIWIYPGLLHLVQTHDRAKLLFAQVLPIAVVTLLAMLAIDRYGYGEWTFVPFNFFKFNVLEVRAVLGSSVPCRGESVSETD